MTCIIARCVCEGRDRDDWPMLMSPALFFDGSGGEDHDLEILADRLGGGTFDRSRLAETVGIEPTAVWKLIRRGTLPRPDRHEFVKTSIGVQDRAIWTAQQVAEVLCRRGRSVTA